MIIDITGTILMPGNEGRDCPGNGEHPGVECCCDECDYMMCCFGGFPARSCDTCTNRHCPRSAFVEK